MGHSASLISPLFIDVLPKRVITPNDEEGMYPGWKSVSWIISWCVKSSQNSMLKMAWQSVIRYNENWIVINCKAEMVLEIWFYIRKDIYIFNGFFHHFAEIMIACRLTYSVIFCVYENICWCMKLSSKICTNLSNAKFKILKAKNFKVRVLFCRHKAHRCLFDK